MCALIILWTKSRELSPDWELYICTCALICFQCIYNLASLHVIFHSVNYDQSFTTKIPSLQHSKVMKLWFYVLFLKPFLFHVILLARKRCKCTCPVAAAVSRLALTTNQTQEQINFGGLKLEKTETLSDVYSCSFHALSKFEKTIHSGLNWGNTVICQDTLKSD